MRALFLVLVCACSTALAADEVSFVNVLTLTPTDHGTQLRAESYGFGTDDESLAMRRFFEAGNQQTIETLRRHFGALTQ